MPWHQSSNSLGKMVHLKQTKTYQTFLRHRHITLFNGFWLVYSLADPVGHKKMNTLLFMVCISYHISCCICYFFICFSSFSDRNKVEFRTSLQAWKKQEYIEIKTFLFWTLQDMCGCHMGNLSRYIKLLHKWPTVLHVVIFLSHYIILTQRKCSGVIKIHAMECGIVDLQISLSTVICSHYIQ